jgi:hypothetical protein
VWGHKHTGVVVAEHRRSPIPFQTHLLARGDRKRSEIKAKRKKSASTRPDTPLHDSVSCRQNIFCNITW